MMRTTTLNLWTKHNNTSLLDCAHLPVEEMCHDQWKETIAWFYAYNLSSTIEFWSVHHHQVKSTIDALLNSSMTSKSLPQCARCTQLMDGHLERIASFWASLLLSTKETIQPQVITLVADSIGEETDEYESSGDESFDDPETTRVSSDGSTKSTISSQSKYIDSSSGSDDEEEEAIQLKSVATVLSSLDASASHPLLSNKTTQATRLPPPRFIFKKSHHSPLLSSNKANQLTRLPPSLIIRKSGCSLLEATKKRKESSSSDSNDSSDDYMDVANFPNKKSNVDIPIAPLPTTKVSLRSGGRASSTLVGVVRKSESARDCFVIDFKTAPTCGLSLRDVVGKDKLDFFCNLEKVGRLIYRFALTEAGLNHYECRAYALNAIGEVITINDC